MASRIRYFIHGKNRTIKGVFLLALLGFFVSSTVYEFVPALAANWAQSQFAGGFLTEEQMQRWVGGFTALASFGVGLAAIEWITSRDNRVARTICEWTTGVPCLTGRWVGFLQRKAEEEIYGAPELISIQFYQSWRRLEVRLNGLVEMRGGMTFGHRSYITSAYFDANPTYPELWYTYHVQRIEDAKDQVKLDIQLLNVSKMIKAIGPSKPIGHTNEIRERSKSREQGDGFVQISLHDDLRIEDEQVRYLVGSYDSIKGTSGVFRVIRHDVAARMFGTENA